MDTRDIQKLIEFIAQSGLDEVNLETNDLKLSVRRNSSTTASPMVASAPQPQAAPAPVMGLPTPVAASTLAAAPAPDVSDRTKAAETTNYITIKSPMIGTFYRLSNPETPAFVEVGDEVKTGKVVCIIEAMKLFNEIESEVSGRIVKVLVENATPVEYDQPLFLVEPV